MDYEKKYKEALSRAREFVSKDNVEAAEYIFPELKESDDEKIRKVLIKGFQHYDKECKWGEFTTTEILSWLEKQGQTFTKKDVDDAYLKGVCDAKHELEKQGEQNTTDKVKLKFQIGDWVVSNRTNKTYKIDNIDAKDANYIIYSCVPSVYTNEDSPCFSESMIHLWTIQDAKDGDVLCWDDSKCIALFKKIYSKESFNSYGFVGHCTGTFESGLSYHDIEGAHPATKEQRDLLFEKMNEANYEWDSNKNELKKIEQKPVNNVKSKFNVGDWVVQDCNILKILGVGNEYYRFETVGGHLDDMLISEVDSSFHLWTIADAKPGDVLCCENYIFLYKCVNTSHNYEVVESFCEILKENSTNCHLEMGSNFLCYAKNAYPATYMQRYRLLYHLKKEGYEWNPDKLELKKLALQSSKEENIDNACKVEYVLEREPELPKSLSNLTDTLIGYFKKGDTVTFNTYGCKMTFNFN